MALTPVNSEDRLVQATFAEHLKDTLGWDSVYAWNDETFGPGGTLGRKDTTEAVLTRDLRAALVRLNPDLPSPAVDDAVRALTVHDFSRSMMQHNRDFARLIRNGVPVSYRDAAGHLRNARVRVIDFDNKPASNRFLAVRELKLTGLRTPNYNRRADLVCFVNGLPLVFIELKAVYKNIRAGFDGNLVDRLAAAGHDVEVLFKPYSHDGACRRGGAAFGRNLRGRSRSPAPTAARRGCKYPKASFPPYLQGNVRAGQGSVLGRADASPNCLSYRRTVVPDREHLACARTPACVGDDDFRAPVRAGWLGDRGASRLDLRRHVLSLRHPGA